METRQHPVTMGKNIVEQIVNNKNLTTDQKHKMSKDLLRQNGFATEPPTETEKKGVYTELERPLGMIIPYN